jgi:hypothetical protein
METTKPKPNYIEANIEFSDDRSDVWIGDPVSEPIDQNRTGNSIDSQHFSPDEEFFAQRRHNWLRNTKNLPFSFSSISRTISIIIYIADIASDLNTARVHYTDRNLIYFKLTLFIIISQSIITNFTSVWILWTQELEGKKKSNEIIGFILHILQLGPVWRYYRTLNVKMRPRSSSYDPSVDPLICQQKKLALLGLMEALLESLPQLLLQSYIIVFELQKTEIDSSKVVQLVLTSIISLLSISCARPAYYKIAELKDFYLENLRFTHYSNTKVQFGNYIFKKFQHFIHLYRHSFWT